MRLTGNVHISKVSFICPQIPLGGKCGLSDAATHSALATTWPDCKGWIDAQRRGCDSSSEGRMGVRGENKQPDIEIDSATSLRACQRSQES